MSCCRKTSNRIDQRNGEMLFRQQKRKLLSSEWLAHYEPSKARRWMCYVSPYGVRTVVSHIVPDGDEHPIAFASRILSSADLSYAQLARGHLPSFGEQWFDNFFFDHWSQTPFGCPKGKFHILNISSAFHSLWMKWWGLILLAFDYYIMYGHSHGRWNGMLNHIYHVLFSEIFTRRSFSKFFMWKNY